MLFGDLLSERLHARPLPEPPLDFDYSSVWLGERMRRRRIAAVVAVLVLLQPIRR